MSSALRCTCKVFAALLPQTEVTNCVFDVRARITPLRSNINEFGVRFAEDMDMEVVFYKPDEVCGKACDYAETFEADHNVEVDVVHTELHTLVWTMAC